MGTGVVAHRSTDHFIGRLHVEFIGFVALNQFVEGYIALQIQLEGLLLFLDSFLEGGTFSFPLFVAGVQGFGESHPAYSSLVFLDDSHGIEDVEDVVDSSSNVLLVGSGVEEGEFLDESI